MTLSMVSDEETFGPWGARYLLEHHPEVIGDRCLNAEPSSPAWRRVKKTANVPVSVAQQFVMVAGLDLFKRVSPWRSGEPFSRLVARPAITETDTRWWPPFDQ